MRLAGVVKTVEILGYKVFCDSLVESIKFDGNKIVINTINAYSYVVAKKDEAFKTALKESSVLLPDGFPIVLASRLLKRKRIKKVAGEDIFYHLIGKVSDCSGKVFFLGSSDETLREITNRIKKEYPSIDVGCYSPPFRDLFSKSEDGDMVKIINAFNPDVLFVGMTAPKQEKWVAANRGRLNATIICSIGAVFDFYAGTYSRPSNFWVKLNLEWFIRLLKEPKRMWRRYLVYSPILGFDILKKWFSDVRK